MARFEQYCEDLKINDYIATSIQLIPQQKVLSMSFHDMLFGEADTRTGDEIAMDIITGAGLTFEE